MTKISIHAMYAADDRSGSRSIRLLRILVSMTLFFNNSIYADNPAKEVKSLQTLSFEASGCAPEILRAIYSALDEEDKEKPTVISLENDGPMTEYAKMDGHLLYKDKYRKIRSLDLSNLGIDDLPGFIFGRMMNLEELNLSGNPNLNLNSETFKKLCQQLTELDVSYCNIDEYVFSIICKRCSKLKALKISENFNINLNSEEFKKLCQQLVVLDASNCNVDENTFAVICSNCPKLKVLRMSNNPRIKFPDQEPIKFKDTLEELKVDNCSLNTADMLKIAGLKSLERLDISNNWLKKYFEKLDFGNLKGTLTELKASNVEMTSENLYKIRECSKITVLDISHNNLKNEEDTNPPTINCNFLDCLANQLISFNASKTNLSIIQLEEVLNSSSIKTLDCSCNDFSGLDDTFKIGGAKSVLEDAKFSNCYLSSQRFLSEILNCPSLAKLDISKNKFNMPYNKFAFESPLKSLKWLNISESKINVRFFIEMLGEFETIEYLDISGGNLTTQGLDHGSIQFDPSNVVSAIRGLKKSLRTLKASNCKLENGYHLLCSLTDCENLEHLDISGNDLSQFPTNFQFGSSRETLKCLNMSNCGYISLNTLKAVTDLKVLEVLNTNNNKYEAQDHFELGDSKNSLKMISMRSSYDFFNSSILQAISECRVLKTLDLSKSNMDRFEFGSFEFGAVKSSLRKINMNGCKINSEIFLRAVLDCKKLQELDLGSNNLSNLSEDFKFGDSKHSLKVLKMNKSQLSSQNMLFEITDCNNLKELKLRSNNFAIISEDFKFGKSKDTLEIIDMSSCGIQSEKVLSEITDCSNLKELNLSENNFSGISSSFSFGNSKHSLKVLRMDQCEMTNEFIAISSCEVLETLSIRYNSFSSYSFGTSKNTLKDLGICGNSFSGVEDFNQIFNCKRLERLDISVIPLDHLEQELDSKNFNMPELKELFVFWCKLTRPSSLTALTSFPKLEKINISGDLFGSFPDGYSLGASKDTLTEITANDCNFSDKHVIKALTDCRRLKVLILCGNRGLKECDTITFGASTNSLKELNPGFCNLDLLDWIYEIKKCTEMQKLVLSGSDWSGVKSELSMMGLEKFDWWS